MKAAFSCSGDATLVLIFFICEVKINILEQLGTGNVMLRIINTNYKIWGKKTSTRGRRWKDKALTDL